MILFRFFIAFTFLLSHASAESLSFHSKEIHYNLSYSTDLIHITGRLVDLSLKKKPCNEKIISSLHRAITNNLKTRIIAEEKFHTLTINNKEYKIDKNSKLGLFLLKLPLTIEENKRKEAFLCNQ